MTAIPTWQHADLEVDGIGIHYARTGTAGKPPVVLLHGFSDSGAVWTPLSRDLAADYDLVAIDTVGHGRSGRPGPGFSRARFVTDTLAVMDALGLARATLLGHSMGAGTAANVAAQAPGRVRALVLEVVALTPATQVAHIPGTSHNIRRDDYPAFLAAVSAFLAAH